MKLHATIFCSEKPPAHAQRNPRINYAANAIIITIETCRSSVTVLKIFLLAIHVEPLAKKRRSGIPSDLQSADRQSKENWRTAFVLIHTESYIAIVNNSGVKYSPDNFVFLITRISC